MKKLLISLLLMVSLLLCLTIANADVPQTISELPILKKSQKPENFSYNYFEDAQTLTVVTENLPAGWIINGAIYHSQNEDNPEVNEEWQSNDRLTWTHEKPPFIDNSCTIYGVEIFRYDEASGVSEWCVYSTENSLLSWELQDESSGTTLDFTGKMYIFYTDETTNNQFYYDLNGELKEKLPDPVVTTYGNKTVHDECTLFFNEPMEFTIKAPTAETILYRIYNVATDTLIVEEYANNGEMYLFSPYLTSEGIYRLYIIAEKTGFISSEVTIKLNVTYASGTCGTNLTWKLDKNRVLTIRGTGKMTDYTDDNAPWVIMHGSDFDSVIIENGVTSIGNSAFVACYTFSDISIPESVTSIGSMAFCNCQNLTSIFIPSSVTTIDPVTTWQNCFSLISIDVDANNQLFSSVNGILYNKDKSHLLRCPEGISGSVDIPDGVNIIRTFSFSGCKEIESISLPDSVSFIRGSAFYGCTGLTTVTLPNTINSIGANAFYNCNNLCDIYYNGTSEQWNTINIENNKVLSTLLNNGHIHFANPTNTCGENLTWTLDNTGMLTISGTGAMEEYGITYSDGEELSSAPWGANVTSVEIEDGVGNIGKYAFYGCTGLTNISIPDSVTDIGNRVFTGCTSLVNITIPDSVTSIGVYAFHNCTSLTDIYYTGSEEQWNSISFGEGNNTLLTANKHYNYQPATIVASGTCGANGDNLIWTLDSNGLLSISGTGSFNTEGIPAEFYQDVVKVYYGSGVTDIPPSEFSYWYKLTEFAVDPENPNYTAVDGVLYNRAKTALIECPTAKTGTLTIPEGVIIIEDDAFIGSFLSSVTLPSSLETIGDQAFWNSKITEITLPERYSNYQTSVFNGCDYLTAFHVSADNPNYAAENGILYSKDKTTLIRVPGGYSGSLTTIPGITAIYASAFQRCESLTAVTLSEGIKAIGDAAFADSGVQSVFLPRSLTTIDTDAFKYADHLTHVEYAGTTEEWSMVSISAGNNLLLFNTIHCTDGDIASQPLTGSIGDGIAYSLTSDGTLTVSGAGTWENMAFLENQQIIHVVLSEGVTEIGEFAFQGCQNLVDIRIPVSVTRICLGAFEGFNSPIDIYYAGTEEDFNSIIIEVGNNILSSAVVHYLGESQLPAPVISNLITGSTIGRDVSFDYHCAEGTERVSLSVGFINDSGNFKTVEGIGINDYDPNSANDTVQLGGYAFRTPGTYQIRMKAYTWSYGEEPSETIADSEETICEFTLEDAELPTITVDLSVTETEFSYGDSELDNLTYSISGADNVALAWWVYSEQTDDVNGSSLSGGYGPTDKLYADIGRNEYTFYGRVNGIWSEPVTKIITVAPAGVLDVPTISYNGTVLNETLTITSGESLVFTVECENAASFTCTVLKELEDGSVDWFADAESSDGVIDLSSYNLSPGTYYLNFGVSSDGWSSPDTERITLTITDGSTLPAPTISVASTTRRRELTISVVGPENAEAIDVIVEAQDITELDSKTFSGSSGEFTVPGWYTTDDFTYVVTAVARITGEGGEEDWIYGEEAVYTFTLPAPAQPEPTVPDHMTFSALEGISGEISMTVEGADAIAYTSFFEGMGGGRPDEFTEGDTVYLTAETDENGDYAYGSYEVSCYARFGDLWYDIGSHWVTIIPVPTTTWSIDDNGVMTVGGTGTFTDQRWRNRYEDIITAVIINEGVTGIGEEAFAYCNSLTSVTLPDGLTYIGDLAFCQSPIQTVTVPAGVPTQTKTYYSIKNGSSSEEVLFNVTLPATVTSANNSFWATNMPRIYPDFKVPSGLRTIDEEAFSGISASFVWLSDDTKSIGSKAFANCSKLKYVRIPEGCTSIAPDAFPKSTILLVPEYDTYASNFADQNGYTVIRMFLGGGNG